MTSTNGRPLATAGTLVAETLEICSLIATYSSTRVRARLMRSSRTLFNIVVRLQYAHCDMAALCALGHLGLEKDRLDFYVNSVRELDVSGSTPYVLDYADVPDIFRRHPNINAVKGSYGESRRRPGSTSADVPQLLHVLDVDLRRGSALFRAHMWRRPSNVPDMSMRAGLAPNDTVTHRTRYTMEDRVFTDDYPSAMEEFITRTPLIEALIVDGGDPKRLKALVRLLKSRSKSSTRVTKPDLVQMNNFFLAHTRKGDREIKNLKWCLESLQALCGTVRVTIKEFIRQYSDPIYGSLMYGRSYHLANQEVDRRVQELERYLAQIDSLLPIVSYRFDINIDKPARHLVVEWTKRLTTPFSAESNQVESIHVNIRVGAYGPTGTHHDRATANIRYINSWDAEGLVDLFTTLFKDDTVSYTLALKTTRTMCGPQPLLSLLRPMHVAGWRGSCDVAPVSAHGITHPDAVLFR